MLPKSFLLLLYRDFIFVLSVPFSFLYHLSRRFEVCKRCRILLYIKLGWEWVCIANSQMYRYRKSLLAANDRIIFSCTRISNWCFPFFVICLQILQIRRTSVKEYFHIHFHYCFWEAGKVFRRTISFLFQGRVYYSFYNKIYHCMQ